MLVDVPFILVLFRVEGLVGGVLFAFLFFLRVRNNVSGEGFDVLTAGTFLHWLCCWLSFLLC